MAGLLAHGLRSNDRRLALAFPTSTRASRGGRFVDREASGPGCLKHACQWLFAPPVPAPLRKSRIARRANLAALQSRGRLRLETGGRHPAAFVAFPLRLRSPGETIHVTMKALGPMAAAVNQAGSQASACQARFRVPRPPGQAPDRPSVCRTGLRLRFRSFSGVPLDRRRRRTVRADRFP